MRTVIVAAVAANGVIGVDDGLPWHIPDDLARFKRLTLGQTVIMGRQTFQSIGRPLPGRHNVVLTRQSGYAPHGVVVASSLTAGIDVARGRNEDACLIGGAEVYRQGLELADRLELTEVYSEPDGDTWFPHVDWDSWTEISRETTEGYAFVTYDRLPV